MKKKILYILIMIMCFIPSFVSAAESKVKVYLFKGSGCQHCENAINYFKSLDDDEKEKFDLVEYEVWYDEDNKALMEKVAKELNEEPTGVPYIVVGKKSFSGFKETTGEEILTHINQMYDDKDFTDIMKIVNGSNPLITIILVGICIVGIITVIVVLRSRKQM